ncbi:hypothetical protein [Streptomyces cyaneofuscatus]|uniref:hypothetical protein n=1 Tax=Streptomyces cyaneofuscatus TaxID=66883 RepID=UPI0036E81F0F
MTAQAAVTAADNLRRELTNAGAHHDPAGMTDTDITRITAAAHQLAAATGRNHDRLLHAITAAHH